jgi:molecular chaperone GrpE (heat shock protein)
LYRDTTTEFQEVFLQKFDVAVFQSAPNSPVDAKRQRALRTVLTDNETLHRHIKQSLRPGYEIDGHVLRSEMVEAYVKQ